MSQFKFSVGPWNVHTGADSYGPETRQPVDLETKFARFAELGFSAIQFHDDDAVPNMNNMTEEEIKAYAREVKKLVEKEGTTVGEKLAGYVREELVRNECKGPYLPAGLTVKNVDRLKHETSFHNPNNLNPDELLNEILTKYFKWLDEARV